MNDLIERQAAIDALCRRCDLVSDDEPCIEECNDIKILKLLPAAQPERKNGEWLDGGMKGVYYCSECKHKIMTNVYVDQRPLWKYCPNCGSYNGGDNNEVD